MFKSVMFIIHNLLVMEGILYLTDENNKKRFVQIDIEKYGGEYLEDLIDGLVAESRKNEESIPFDQAMEELRNAGKLDE